MFSLVLPNPRHLLLTINIDSSRFSAMKTNKHKWHTNLIDRRRNVLRIFDDKQNEQINVDK